MRTQPGNGARRILQPKLSVSSSQSTSSDHVGTSNSNPAPTNRKRGRSIGSKSHCSKPKALRGVKVRLTDPITTHNHTSAGIQPYFNDAAIHSPDTIERPDISRDQHIDITLYMNQDNYNGMDIITQPNNDSNTSTPPQLYSCDHNDKKNDIGNPPHNQDDKVNINQNNTNTYTHHNHSTMHYHTHKCNNDDHINLNNNNNTNNDNNNNNNTYSSSNF
jgi:hypothetical protein